MIRITMALKLRAERQLREGRIAEAKQTLVEWYDMEKASGSISQELYNMVNKLETKESV